MFSNLFNSKRIGMWYVFIALAVVFITVLQDVFHAQFNRYSFYLSESLLFNGFWLLFPPMLFVQKFLLRYFSTVNRSRLFAGAIGTGTVAGIHLLLFPPLLVAFSALFFSHTYGLSHGFSFELSGNLLACIAVYSLNAVAYYREQSDLKPATPPVFQEQFTVTSGATSILIAAKDILYVRASTPYVSIVTGRGKFLHKQTIRDFNASLDPSSFLRIHKSTIVNLGKVTAVQSRLNGDYDLVMEHGEMIRMSRNYANAFKARMK